jgi:hypothetical protein
LRIHQSLINEEARAVLGGKTYPLNELLGHVERLIATYLRDARADAARRAGMEALEKLLKGLGKKPATITLAKDNPLSVVLTDSGFTVEFHAAAMGLAGKAYAGVRVRAAYRLRNTAAGVSAVRQKPVQFLPPAKSGSGKNLEPPGAALRLAEEAVFGQILKEELALADLLLPAPLDRLGPLTPSRAAIRNGWVVLDWKLKKGAKSQPARRKP